MSEPEIVAEGLDNPYKLSFGPDGALYVAESGTGGEPGSESCVEQPDPEGGEPTTNCVGPTGAVTRIDLSGDEPTQERVVEGLASVAAEDSEGNGAGGPTSVVVGEDGTIYVILGLGGNLETRDALGEVRPSWARSWPSGPRTAPRRRS